MNSFVICAQLNTYREQQTHDTQTQKARTHLSNSAVVNLGEFSNDLIRYRKSVVLPVLGNGDLPGERPFPGLGVGLPEWSQAGKLERCEFHSAAS